MNKSIQSNEHLENYKTGYNSLLLNGKCTGTQNIGIGVNHKAKGDYGFSFSPNQVKKKLCTHEHVSRGKGVSGMGTEPEQRAFTREQYDRIIERAKKGGVKIITKYRKGLKNIKCEPIVLTSKGVSGMPKEKPIVNNLISTTNVYGLIIDIDEKTQYNFIEENFPNAKGEKVEVRVKFTNNKGIVAQKDFMLGEFLEKLGFFPV